VLVQTPLIDLRAASLQGKEGKEREGMKGTVGEGQIGEKRIM